MSLPNVPAPINSISLGKAKSQFVCCPLRPKIDDVLHDGEDRDRRQGRQGGRPDGVREHVLVGFDSQLDRLFFDQDVVVGGELVPIAAEGFPDVVELGIHRVARDARGLILSRKDGDCLGPIGEGEYRQPGHDRTENPALSRSVALAV